MLPNEVLVRGTVGEAGAAVERLDRKQFGEHFLTLFKVRLDFLKMRVNLSHHGGIAMRTVTASPLSQLIEQGIQAIGERLISGGSAIDAEPVSSSVERLAGGLLAAMGMHEVADDLDLEAVSLLGAASLAGLKVIGMAEPGVYRLEDALHALEDLLRRTAEQELR